MSKPSESMLEALATYVAEHQVMKKRLLELGEIKNCVPLRWSNDEPLVDLPQVISKFIEESEGYGNIPRPSDN